MCQLSFPEHPMPDCAIVPLEATPPGTFQPMPSAAGPTYENWMQYLVYIRGAVLALGFNDGELTERMRRGYDTDAEALEAVHAWAETERQLAAAIDILRTAQARCTLGGSRRDEDRAPRPEGSDWLRGRRHSFAGKRRATRVHQFDSMNRGPIADAPAPSC